MHMYGAKKSGKRNRDSTSIRCWPRYHDICIQRVPRFSPLCGQWKWSPTVHDVEGLIPGNTHESMGVTMHQTPLLHQWLIPSQCKSFSCFFAWIPYGCQQSLTLNGPFYKEDLRMARSCMWRCQMVLRKVIKATPCFGWMCHSKVPSRWCTVSSRHLQSMSKWCTSNQRLICAYIFLGLVMCWSYWWHGRMTLWY